MAAKRKSPAQLQREIDRALSGAQQKRAYANAFAESMGHTYEPPRPIAFTSGKDHGCDPLGPNDAGVFMFRMVPSGDIVDQAEMRRRLPPPRIR